MIGLTRFSMAAALVLLPMAMATAPAQPDVPHPVAQRVLCEADLTPPTWGDDLLATQKDAAAADFFREALKRNANDANARLGFVHALIEENKPQQAQDELDAWKIQSPQDALEEVAAGDLAYREADIVLAEQDATEAMKLNHCEGRAFALDASVAMLNGRYAWGDLLWKLAHQLRPQDELIWRDWLATLPLAEHIAELQVYLNSDPHLLQTQRDGLTRQLEELKVHRPGECHILNPDTQATIALKQIYAPPGQSMTYGIPVSFDGKRRLLEVDTGASGITLTASVAKHLGLHPEFYRSVDGVGNRGRSNGYETHVKTIRIGNMLFANCMVQVVDHSQWNADGLIGADMFSPWIVTLDYPEQQLRLSPLPNRESLDLTEPEPAEEDAGSIDGIASQDSSIAPQMPEWLHVLRIGDELLIPVRLDQGPEHYFIADTGSSQTTLSLALANQTHHAYIDFDTRMWGINGDIDEIYRVDDSVLQFGQFQLPPTHYDAFDYAGIVQQAGVEVSGLLGIPTFSTMKISIDFRDNMVKMSGAKDSMHRKRPKDEVN